ncbi:hypothetical protein A2714_02475 [Candidatus Woesebacteria bacterium RIFCSPHIGHO2_01_FULL_38_9]|uniref:Cell envelope-related transcriptional attenuator domain-containing protein n=2 Tax=Candidatus Woeseibacteriota TaxID=1752722 RepID=A0A1F7Y3G5_9BACT|nr:MAG: hypothetical protein A2714_02475 [Candidatus Woesebacteria bacterium RIFCSPHIGHO2_01_FULL_38_9]OGM59199.1 MAG: hypothetical protein A3A75_03225 [Candidatus Woesebacteria bacterium RIFCSPLOWO2_01_FULL_39_10]
MLTISFAKISKRFKYIAFILLFILSFFVGAVASYIFLHFQKVFVANKPAVEVNDFIDSDLSKSFTVLVLGYGGAGHDGGNLSDVILVAHINPETKKVTFISVPRDLWVELPMRSDLRESRKVNAAYAIGSDDKNYPLKEPQYKGEAGGGTMAKEVVSKVIGMPITYFIAVDFEGFKNIVDTLGGVEVNVPVTFDDYFYPIKGRENDTCGKSSSEIVKLHELYSDTELHHQFECRYEHIHYDQGSTKMNGDEALKFVRSRASAQHGGDFARSLRQQAVLTGIKEKFISGESLEKIDETFGQLSKMIRTDLDLTTIKQLLEIYGSPEDYSFSYIGLNDQNVFVATKSLDSQFILIPKEGENVWTEVHKYILEEINKSPS